MNTAFFFQTQQITDNTILFNELKQQNIFFSYFQVDQNYYLFVYAQKSIDINFLYQSIDVIQELDAKQRKIRSFRGFFLYALEILEKGKDYQILTTNLQPFFWRKVKNIIRQNQKGALLKFLFGKDEDNKSVNPALDAKIQTLQNQVNSLQQQIIELKQQSERSEQNQTLQTKKALSELLNQLQASKSDQQDDSTLNLQENDNKFRQQGERSEQQRDEISESVSEAPKTPLKPLSNPQQYNIPLNPDKGLNEKNFITLSNLSEDQKIEIIKTGFQLQAEGKISLKKYYESTDPNSLFQSKGYFIKYVKHICFIFEKPTCIKN